MEHVSDVFGVKLVIVENQRISYAKSHAAIISPNAYSSDSRLKNIQLNLLLNVRKIVFDEIFSIFDEWYELGRSPESITDSQA